MAILKHIRTSITAIVLITTLMITVTTSIQPVFAPRTCGQCITQFQILTRSFGANAGKIILSGHSIPISQFVQLNLQFTKDIIKAVYDGHVSPQDPVIPNLVSKYGDDLKSLNPPAPVIPLLRAYQQDVLDIFFPIR
jgi:hypothetical protein